jgi:hypothetical protein
VAYGRSIKRGGDDYNRLAEPDWKDPLDTSYSLRGGRWNPPRAFPALYLNRGVRVARLQVQHKLAGQPYGVEDLEESEQHDLVEVDVAERRDWLDCVTERGLAAVALPTTYPHHPNGRPVSHGTCQPIGAAAYGADRPGVACRSAASREPTDEELAVFDSGGIAAGRRAPFAEWYWQDQPGTSRPSRPR